MYNNAHQLALPVIFKPACKKIKMMQKINPFLEIYERLSFYFLLIVCERGMQTVSVKKVKEEFGWQ